MDSGSYVTRKRACDSENADFETLRDKLVRDGATGRGYMASPYSRLPQRVAVAHAKWWMSRLSRELGPGVPLFSPVMQGASMDVDWTWDDWMRWSFASLSGCTFLIVPSIPGRDESRGVAAEVEWAEARNMAVIWL